MHGHFCRLTGPQGFGRMPRLALVPRGRRACSRNHTVKAPSGIGGDTAGARWQALLAAETRRGNRRRRGIDGVRFGGSESPAGRLSRAVLAWRIGPNSAFRGPLPRSACRRVGWFSSTAPRAVGPPFRAAFMPSPARHARSAAAAPLPPSRHQTAAAGQSA